MTRHTCIICGKKRESKFMITLPYNMKETLTTGNSWICFRKRNWRDKSLCIAKFIETRQNIINEKQNNLNDFKTSVQERHYN